MNVTPSINLNATNAAQPAANGKQNAPTEAPFKQVLSKEMAHKRSENAARENRDQKTVSSDAAPASKRAAEQDAAANNPKTDEPASAATEALLAQVTPPDALKTQPIENALGLAIPGLQLATTEPPDGEADASTLSLSLDLDTASSKGRAANSRTADLNDPSNAQNATPPTAKNRLQAATQEANAQSTHSSTATNAAAFAGQLAASRQADVLKTRELPTELMGATSLRPTAQADIPMPSVDPLASSKLTPSVGTTAWSQALSEKVVWMASGAQQTASLTLNPPNLGPLQIVLNLTNDQASASFFSAQPEVRQALEAAFPKLREMLNDAGIQLGQATVSAENPHQNEASDRQAQRASNARGVTDDGVNMTPDLTHATTHHMGRGLVDTFA